MDEIGKNQDKSMNEASVSSISTHWSIQSISLKSDLPIFVVVDKSIPIFIDWLLRVYSLRFQVRIRMHDLPVKINFCVHIDGHKELVGDLSQSEKRNVLKE